MEKITFSYFKTFVKSFNIFLMFFCSFFLFPDNSYSQFSINSHSEFVALDDMPGYYVGDDMPGYHVGLPLNELDRIRSKSQLKMENSFSLEDVLLFQAQSGITVGAAYPIKGFQGVYFTAMHLVKNFEIKKKAEPRTFKVFGLQQKLSDAVRLLDFAILVENSSEGASSYRAFLGTIRSNPQPLEYLTNKYLNSNIYMHHLDFAGAQRIPVITTSSALVTSEESAFVFFPKNEPQSSVGHGSSGAVVYSVQHALPVGVIICGWKFESKPDQPRVGIYKFSFLFKNFELVQINQERLRTTEKLDCDPYNGRGAGGFRK